MKYDRKDLLDLVTFIMDHPNAEYMDATDIVKQFESNKSAQGEALAVRQNEAEREECKCGKPVDPDYSPCCSYDCWFYTYAN